MSNVIFVNLCEVKGTENVGMGVLSLTAVLKSKGYTVENISHMNLKSEKIICGNGTLTMEELERISEFIISLKPEIVDFYTMCNDYHEVIALSKILKSKDENLKIILGGPQASLTAENTLKNFSWIDAIGIGEGEETIEGIIRALLENDESFLGVEGVAFLNDKNEVVVRDRVLIENLDTLPYIDYSRLNIRKKQFAEIDVGRGCPFQCKYCSTKTFWKQNFRMKSKERIIKEMKILMDQHGARRFNFNHDLFTANKKWIMTFCDKLKEENLDVEWQCSARIDTVDEEMISAMASAGCRKIYFGIESGSPKIQRTVKKNLRLDSVINTVKMIKKYDLGITCSFIYGFVDETMEDIRETMMLMNNLVKCGVEAIQYHPLTIQPGTELLEELEDKLIYLDDSSDITGNGTRLGEYKEMIMKNKNVFPQFFFYKDRKEDKTYLLSKFMQVLYRFVYKNLKYTTAILNKLYNSDLLEIYMDVINNSESYLDGLELTDIIGNDEESYLKCEKIILRLFKDKNSNKESSFYYDMVRFELDMFKTVFFGISGNPVKIYGWDVFSTWKNGKLSPQGGKTKLKFDLVNGEDLKISKIA